MKEKETIASRIRENISRFHRGKIFFAEDFLDLGGINTVRRNLARIAEEKDSGVLRIANGVYLKPKTDETFGFDVLYPSLHDLSMKIAQQRGIRLAPTYETALNILHLSTQVQTNTVFLTNGSNAKIKTLYLGEGEIRFEHCGDKRVFRFKNTVMQMIYLAMKFLGRDGISEDNTKRIRDIYYRIPVDVRKLDDMHFVSWMKKAIQ